MHTCCPVYSSKVSQGAHQIVGLWCQCANLVCLSGLVANSAEEELLCKQVSAGIRSDQARHTCEKASRLSIRAQQLKILTEKSHARQIDGIDDIIDTGDATPNAGRRAIVKPSAEARSGLGAVWNFSPAVGEQQCLPEALCDPTLISCQLEMPSIHLMKQISCSDLIASPEKCKTTSTTIN